MADLQFVRAALPGEQIRTGPGLSKLFSTLAASAGPHINGWISALAGNNDNLMMIVGPMFMLPALARMLGLRRGEDRGDHQKDLAPAVEPGLV
ncbi:MAG TPA: hypothetical protein VGJ97_04255 [Anaerolineaceae bacterium]